MRHRDETKKQALHKATIQVVKEEGFASASVNKIAKKAGVAPATLYIYFSNKDDLLTSTFMVTKTELSDYILSDFDSAKSLKDNVHAFWTRLYDYVSNYPDDYQYIDQFSHSPLIQHVDTNALEAPYQEFHKALSDGIEQGVLKDIPKPMMLSFILAPVVFLARSRLGASLDNSAHDLDQAFSLAWDAISD
ncbi:TetR/AcrR family transcriptional regulator [Marinomonas ostreistagni]|uniref:TetR/AcrR family transcriptional regulator n=1 Tax=Marinomonas ostreistagni TaxID=359209 RepID=A0ABS0ZE62_9GAMM|nr:TetR/AcrR family transcriptional regulator [Marinomonas ostreistagni]MBJ7551673.1 TetR/AcrR family transcriptional regulator [Marinomonas ostreistagni]